MTIRERMLRWSKSQEVQAVAPSCCEDAAEAAQELERLEAKMVEERRRVERLHNVLRIIQTLQRHEWRKCQVTVQQGLKT